MMPGSDAGEAAFFLLSTYGEANPDYCRLDERPEGADVEFEAVATGKRATSYYPRPARVFMSELFPGIQLTSLLGNIHSYLIVCSALKEVIAKHCQNIQVEYLDFELYDHRRRLYSQDYFFVNPLGTLDCLAHSACDATYRPDGTISLFRRLALDPVKVRQAPALFRIRETSLEYVVNTALARAMREGGFTNIVLTPLPYVGPEAP